MSLNDPGDQFCCAGSYFIVLSSLQLADFLILVNTGSTRLCQNPHPIIVACDRCLGVGSLLSARQQ